MRAVIFSSLFFLSGCLSNDVLMSSSNAQKNVEHISQLQIGMTQDEVYQIMRYPSSEDQITTQDGSYDIWFYVTRGNVLDQNRPAARNLTPLIFKDGIFIGMGREYYNHLVKKTKEPTLAPAVIPEEPANEPENIELEKSLAPQEPASPTPPAQIKEKPAPKKPTKVPPQGPLSMSKNPKPPAPDETQPPQSEKDNKDKLDEEDRKMLDRAQEENFNDW